MNQIIKKSIYFISIPLIIQSCSSTISDIKPLSNKLSDSSYKQEIPLTKEEINNLDKEYLPFNTKALSEEYMKRKISKFTTTNNSSKLIKELYYLGFKQKSNIFNLFLNDTTLLSQVNLISGIMSEKNASQDFSDAFPDAPLTCFNINSKISVLDFNKNKNIITKINQKNIDLNTYEYNTQSQINQLSTNIANSYNSFMSSSYNISTQINNIQNNLGELSNSIDSTNNCSELSQYKTQINTLTQTLSSLESQTNTLYININNEDQQFMTSISSIQNSKSQFFNGFNNEINQINNSYSTLMNEFNSTRNFPSSCSLSEQELYNIQNSFYTLEQSFNSANGNLMYLQQNSSSKNNMFSYYISDLTQSNNNYRSQKQDNVQQLMMQINQIENSLNNYLNNITQKESQNNCQ